MSFEAMAWAVKKELPAMQKIVLLLLANRTNADTGQCTPSHDRLAKDCGMTSRSVKAQIAKLVEAGYLTVTPRSKEGLSLSNQYTLALNDAGGNQVPPRGNDVPGGGESRSYLGGNHVPTKQEDKTVNETTSLYIAEKPSKKYSPMASLLAAGVDEQVASDWLEIRKAKKAAPIKTQIEGVIQDLAAAGFTANDGINMCVKKGWARFEQEWLTKNQPQQQRQPSAYQQKQDRQQALLDRIQGNSNAHRSNIIDIN